MSDRVRIGTCSGLADAALVRSVFTAHGVHVVVGSEHHASVLTGLGGGFVSFDIWVNEDDREDAEALLRDLREREAGESDWDGEDDDNAGEHDAAATDAADAADAADGTRDRDKEAIAPWHVRSDAADPWEVRGDARPVHGDARASHADDEGPRAFRERIDRRRATAAALLLGCLVTFGTAHAFTRAWLRFVLLGGIEIVGIMYLVDGNSRGVFAIVGAVAADVIGAVWRIHTAPRPGLPAARARDR